LASLSFNLSIFAKYKGILFPYSLHLNSEKDSYTKAIGLPTITNQDALRLPGAFLNTREAIVQKIERDPDTNLLIKCPKISKILTFHKT